VWAGFFNNSTTHQEIQGSLNPPTGKFQEGGDITNNNYAKNGFLSTFDV
jgi:hypothetical protein